MRDDLIIGSVLLFAAYLMFFSISFNGVSDSCDVGEKESRQVSMCMNTDVQGEVTKPYLGGLLELPVYRFGFNIEYLHYGFFLMTAVLLGAGLLKDNH